MTIKKNKNVAIEQPKTPEKLTLLNLSQLDKQQDEVVTVFLAEGKFQLEINKKFRNTLIQKLILDYIDAISVIRKEASENTAEDLSTMILIRQTLIIKYFTNLGLKNLDCSKKKDIEKLLAVANQLLDSGVFKELMESFDEEELKKIDDAMKVNKAASNQIGELFTSIALAEQEKINVEQELTEGDDSGHNESSTVTEGNSEED